MGIIVPGPRYTMCYVCRARRHLMRKLLALSVLAGALAVATPAFAHGWHAHVSGGAVVVAPHVSAGVHVTSGVRVYSPPGRVMVGPTTRWRPGGPVWVPRPIVPYRGWRYYRPYWGWWGWPWYSGYYWYDYGPSTYVVTTGC